MDTKLNKALDVFIWVAHRVFIAVFIASLVIAIVVGTDTKAYMYLGDFREEITGWGLLFAWPIAFGNDLWNNRLFMGLAMPSWIYMLGWFWLKGR